MSDELARKRAIARARARLRLQQASEQAPAQSTASGALDSFTDGLTMGFGDELTALEAALVGRRPGGGTLDVGNFDGGFFGGFNDRREAALDAERAQNEEFTEDQRATAIGSEIAGALLGAGKLANAGFTLARKGPQTMGRVVGTGAAEGAAYGAIYGAGEDHEGSRIDGALYGAGTGAATGAGASAILGALTRGGAAKKAVNATPTVQELKARGGELLDGARALNPRYEGFDDFAMQAYKVMPEEGFDPVLHPRVASALDYIEDLSKGGTAPDYRSLEILRKRLRSAAGAPEAEERRLGKMLRDALDDFVGGGGSKGMSPRDAALVDGGIEQLRGARMASQGRKLWSRAKKAELIEGAILKAERRAASTGSGGNTENAIRQNIRRILDNDKLARGFTPDEIQAMENVVRGEPVQNLMRLVGKLSPQGNGLMLSLTAGAGAAAGATANPLFLVPTAIGAVAKPLAERSTMANADILSALVRSGGRAAAIKPPVGLSQNRQALVDAISGYLGGQSGALMGP